MDLTQILLALITLASTAIGALVGLIRKELAENTAATLRVEAKLSFLQNPQPKP